MSLKLRLFSLDDSTLPNLDHYLKVLKMENDFFNSLTLREMEDQL